MTPAGSGIRVSIGTVGQPAPGLEVEAEESNRVLAL